MVSIDAFSIEPSYDFDEDVPTRNVRGLQCPLSASRPSNIRQSGSPTFAMPSLILSRSAGF